MLLFNIPMMKNQLFFLTHYFKSIKIDSWCVWQDRCFPLLDTRRIGHQVFTALTLDSFCLLLIHITKEKKKENTVRIRYHRVPKAVQNCRSNPLPHARLHTAEERSNSLRCMFQAHSRIFLKFHQRNRKHRQLSRSSSLSLGLSQPYF